MGWAGVRLGLWDLVTPRFFPEPQSRRMGFSAFAFSLGRLSAVPWGKKIRVSWGPAQPIKQSLSTRHQQHPPPPLLSTQLPADALKKKTACCKILKKKTKKLPAAYAKKKTACCGRRGRELLHAREALRERVLNYT